MLFPRSHKEHDEYWVSISDLMSGLMMIFLFIAISYMVQAVAENKRERMARQEAELAQERALIAEAREREARNKLEGLASNYRDLQHDIYVDLEVEFAGDLELWAAVLDRDSLSIRFEEPEVLFDQGSARLKPQFLTILDEFFPRYVQIITQDKYLSDIEEVRIEGHTSSEWAAEVGPDDAYILNMELSQNRTRAVLKYVLNLDTIRRNREWLKSVLTANGLSSSRLIFHEDIEDREQSRRVEFRIKTDAEKKMSEILSQIGVIQ